MTDEYNAPAASSTPALMSVNVHITGGTSVRAHRSGSGRVWLEFGRADGSVAVFLDRAGLARVVDALSEATDLLPPDRAAA